jgi:hypothetical protein
MEPIKLRTMMVNGKEPVDVPVSIDRIVLTVNSSHGTEFDQTTGEMEALRNEMDKAQRP